MKLLIKNGLIALIFVFVLTFSSFLYFKGGEYIASFFLPVWSPPSITEFPSVLKVETNDCEIIVPVEIEGKVYKFLLDTNRPFSLGVLDKLEFKNKKFELIKDVFGFGLVQKLKIGKMEYRLVRLPLLGNGKNLGFKLNNIPEGYDGVLGNDFIFNVNMSIQLAKKSIIIDKPLARPKDRNFSEIKLKTDLIPLLPRAYVNFLGSNVVLQLKNLDSNTSIKIEESAYARSIEKSPKDEDLDPTVGHLGNFALDGVQKKEVNLIEKYTGVDGDLGCGLLKKFQTVGLDYKSGNLFVVR